MRKGEAIPAVPRTALLSDAILEMSRKGMGMTAIVEPDGRVAGIFTDGDLRRTLGKPIDLRETPVERVMSAHPRTIQPERLAAEAVKLMDDHRITQILVVDADSRLVGALNLHDLFQAKVL
jgi:arabinose-5-phosphate isomerase